MASVEQAAASEVMELHVQEESAISSIRQAQASEIAAHRMQGDSAISAAKLAQATEIAELRAKWESTAREARHLAEMHSLLVETEDAMFEELKYEMAATKKDAAVATANSSGTTQLAVSTASGTLDPLNLSTYGEVLKEMLDDFQIDDHHVNLTVEDIDRLARQGLRMPVPNQAP